MPTRFTPAASAIVRDGTAKRTSMSSLFTKYPQLRALEDRELLLSGKRMGGCGIMWNDDLDMETETICEDRITAREE